MESDYRAPLNTPFPSFSQIYNVPEGFVSSSSESAHSEAEQPKVDMAELD